MQLTDVRGLRAMGVAGASWTAQSAFLLGGLDLGGAAFLLTAGSIDEFVFIGYLLVEGAQMPAAPGRQLNIERRPVQRRMQLLKKIGLSVTERC